MSDVDIPEELEFFLREFGLSNKHNPSEGVISYIKQFNTGNKLIFSYEISSTGYYVSAEIEINNEKISHVCIDEVSSVTFQSWGDEKIIRVYSKSYHDFRIHYLPKARIFYGEE
ncbi:MAG: hypothetical protein KDC52_06225 [Ignavibacteriae bacterium]|nr:hypothetical protein [Ignavibacteriota bacterium]MCB1595003.1 hypothetical protein [Xanthomonadales bacterium]